MNIEFLAHCILIVIGLIICFGGIYIRKIVSGIMGFIWGLTAGIALIMLLAGDALMSALIFGSSDSDSMLYILLALTIAIAVTYISIKFDQLCAAINAFLASFILFLIMLLVLSSKIGALLVILALLGAAVIAYISYLYYMYAFVIVTAFSGGLLASLGIDGMVHNTSIMDMMLGYSDGMTLILLCTIALGCAGTVFQVRQLHRMMGEGQLELPSMSMCPGKNFKISFTIDSECLRRELVQDKLLFIVPIVIFFILPAIDHYWNDSIIAIYVIGILDAVLKGVFLGGLIYSAAANCTLFGLIYLLPYCAGQIFNYHMLFQNDFYGRMVVLFTYVFLLLILKIIFALATDKKAALIVMTGVTYVWDTWGTTILHGLNGNSLVGINLYNILHVVTAGIFVWYLYETRIKEVGSAQSVRKRRNLFATATVIIFIVTAIGLTVEYIENRESINFELGIIKESAEIALTSDEEFEGYSSEMKEFAAFLDGGWYGDRGSTIVFYADNGELTLTRNGETHTYTYNQLDFDHNGIVDTPWLGTIFNRESDDVLQYHHWFITPSGTTEFFEVFCDYSRKELCWGYYEDTGKGAHQTSAENFYMTGEDYDNGELMNENNEGNMNGDSEETLDNDFEENEITEYDTVESIVSEIRNICEQIDKELSSMATEDGGSGTTRYIDSDGKIRMITTKAGAYYDLDASVQNSEAAYFYDTLGPSEKVCFVSVTSENGDVYKFYLKDSLCYRYIDGDGEIYDYPSGISPMELSAYGEFCSRASLEIAWSR